MLAVFSTTLTRTAPAAARMWGAASAGIPQSLAVLRIAAPSSPTSLSPFLASQSRGSKHPSYNGKKLPGYLLPHQSEKTSHLKQMLKMKWHRLKAGKAGQRPKAPRYGRDDFVLSKMNM
ncbi:hypothetical protein HDU88_002455 [Geranomyces variabilis]|nr:hypothetical protein HDU88_002455 [Geranomyces variabilis]